MRSIEVTAKSVDEAIFMGIDQLGLSIDQVDIEIIEEGGRRLFGTAPSPGSAGEELAPASPYP